MYIWRKWMLNVTIMAAVRNSDVRTTVVIMNLSTEIS